MVQPQQPKHPTDNSHPVTPAFIRVSSIRLSFRQTDEWGQANSMRETQVKYWLALIAGVLAFQISVVAADEKPLTLAKDGKSSFVIVTATEPEVEERTAATWLSETLEQVTGVKFPIRSASSADANEIRVRFDAELKPEEWRIQTVGQSLLLTGGRPRGVIYAVCEFLESQVGVARIDPFTEFVPKQPTLTIPALNRRGRPAFPNRFVFTGWPYQNSLPRGVNGDRWRVWNKEHIYAGPVNGDYPRAVPDGVHTFGHFISAKEFAAEHPEYFSMDAAGKRMTDSGSMDGVR